eukprot:4999219-Amphidinium_carterae.1
MPEPCGLRHQSTTPSLASLAVADAVGTTPQAGQQKVACLLGAATLRSPRRSAGMLNRQPERFTASARTSYQSPDQSMTKNLRCFRRKVNDQTLRKTQT